jgi:four helix bundle protein
MNSLSSLSDLIVWQRARVIRKNISLLTKSFPKDEKYRLIDQILRSSRSIAANIAEGYGRFHYKENIHFCLLARGSLTETLEHLCCAHDEGYISTDQFNEHSNNIQKCHKMLNAYIRSIGKKKLQMTIDQ